MMFAHGVGSRGDLPLPLWMFTWASALALIVSFVGLGMLWTRPQLARFAGGRAIGRAGTAGETVGTAAGRKAVGVTASRKAVAVTAGRPVAGAPIDDSAAERPIAAAEQSRTLPGPVRALLALGRAAALILYVTALAAGLLGEDATDRNLLPVTFYVAVWVGAQLVNGLVGDVWRAISPINTLARAAESAGRSAGRTPRSAPARFGQWPAALGLLVFLFYELAHPSGSTPRALGWLLLIHLLISLAAAVRWGASWVADNEPFAALFTMLAAMAPIFARPGDGRLAVRPPMSGLARMPVVGGTLAALLVVLGGTTFDGFSESEAGREVLGRPTGWGGAVTLSLGLAASIAVVAVLYGIGVWWTGRVTELSARDAATAFAPSLVPIVFGYAIAHYAQLLVDETQSFVFRLSDPGGRGWDLFGGADGTIDFNLLSVDLIAWVQVLAILFGHIGAVVVAHDRAVELFPAGESLRSQFAMLLVMVAYSTLGLWLLLNA